MATEPLELGIVRSRLLKIPAEFQQRGRTLPGAGLQLVLPTTANPRQKARIPERALSLKVQVVNKKSIRIPNFIL
jgi:hypothetical protein